MKHSNFYSWISCLCIMSISLMGCNLQQGPGGTNIASLASTNLNQSGNPDDIQLEINPSLLEARYANIPKVSLNRSLDLGVGIHGLENDFKIQDHGNSNKPVWPILECVRHNPNGTFTAFFGYKNDNDFPVAFPRGHDNHFDDNEESHGQPTVF